MQESKMYRRLVVYLTDDETWALQEGVKVLRWIYHVWEGTHCVHYRYNTVCYRLTKGMESQLVINDFM